MPASRPPSDYSGRASSQHPTVPRPRGMVIDAIEQEGVSWEGEVDIVGHEGDIAARLIITTERFLLTHRDDVLLESPRSWLVPSPLVVDDNGIRVSITPEGVVPGRVTSERLHLRIRDGRGPAMQLVAILTGRSRADARAEAEFPSWDAGVGAGRANALPRLPAFETRQDEPPSRHLAAGDPETRGVAPISDWHWQASEGDATPPPWRAAEAEPVEASSRAARFLAHRPAAGVPDTAPEGDTGYAAPVTPIAEERKKRAAGWVTWTSRVAVLALVILAASWFGRQYLPEPVTERLPAFVTNDLASDGEGSESDVAGSDAENGDGTDGAENDPADIMPTEVALGLGGSTTEAPASQGDDETFEPLGEVAPPPSSDEGTGGETSDVDNSGDSGSTDDSDEAGEPGNTGQEGNELIPEPDDAVAETPAPTTAPPEQQIEQPADPGQELQPAGPTATAQDQQLDGGSPAPTVAGRPEPTVAPEETPEVAPSEPTLEPQRASVNPENPPAQAFAVAGFRYSVEGASSGSSLPELPEVAEITYGEWVVLSVKGINWTDSDQVFDMSQFTLLADGEPMQIDVGNSWVASLLNYTPAYGNTDAILWAPGEEHQFVLTFLAPRDAQSLVLQAGDQRFDLATVLSTSGGLMNLNQATAPETIDAVVVGVEDGESIVIEKDGIQQTVRYLGIDVPDEEDCFYAESTDANRELVEGKNVKIERQATNVDAQGNWVRDVWVETDEGRYILVAHQLVQQGSAVADISEPNTRFTGWLRGAEAVAQAEGRGMWGVCTAEQLSELVPEQSVDGIARRVALSA